MKDGSVAIWRRILAFYADMFIVGLVFSLIAFPIVIAINLVWPEGPSNLLMSLFNAFFGSLMLASIFGYQLRALLAGKSTVGQRLLKFRVETNSQDFEVGRLHRFLESCGFRIVSSDSNVWPALLHLCVAFLTFPTAFIPIALGEFGSKNRFLWARLSGTQLIDIRALPPRGKHHDPS